jgi:hypothetical protein
VNGVIKMAERTKKFLENFNYFILALSIGVLAQYLKNSAKTKGVI